MSAGPAAVKRGPGRPRKHPLPPIETAMEKIEQAVVSMPEWIGENVEVTMAAAPAQEPKKRGRPRKHPQPAGPVPPPSQSGVVKRKPGRPPGEPAGAWHGTPIP